MEPQHTVFFRTTSSPTHETWKLICGPNALPVAGIRVALIEVSQTNKWHLIETKTADEHGRITLATKPYKDSENEDFILKVYYSYEPVVDQGDETPFSVAHENETFNEDSSLTEELLLDEDVRRTGNVALTDVPCLAYVNTKRALDDFRTATGRNGHPGGAIRVIFSKHIGETIGAPYAALSTIQLPLEYRLNYVSALHALGHTLR